MIVFSAPAVRTDRLQMLRHSVVDLRALERYLLEALEVQQSESRLRASAEAAALVERVATVLRRHIARLDEHRGLLDDSGEAAPTGLSRSVAGVFVGFVCKMRSHEVSAMLRDDHTLLNLASIGYAALHATALAFEHVATAELALEHLRELTPLIAEINRLMPLAVIEELAATSGPIASDAADQATANLQAAWSTTTTSRRGAGGRYSGGSRSPF
jgi:hypothetical protein